MVKVEIAPEAKQQFLELPQVIQQRVLAVLERLKRWPQVSGAKPLRHDLKGAFRLRTGDWRVLVREDGEVLRVFRIEHRRDVYER